MKNLHRTDAELISEEPDYLKPYSNQIDYESICQIISKRRSYLYRKDCPPYWDTLRDQPALTAQKKDYQQGVVTIGSASEINSQTQEIIRAQLSCYKSWRKGPFSIFGIEIDSEWQSNLKWARLENHIDPLTDKTICDVGCNNGYYMFRCAAQRPKLVIGLDPVHRYKFNFQYLNNFAQEPNLFMELMGFEELVLFPNFFDTIFLMGIIYHHRHPLQILEYAHQALKPNGQLILDSMTIPGEEPLLLFPERRYAKAPGVWFVPTAKALLYMLQRTHYADSKIIYNAPHKPEEQRRTAWAESDSFAEFLSPDNPESTIEGYPAPHRVYITARKKS